MRYAFVINVVIIIAIS